MNIAIITHSFFQRIWICFLLCLFPTVLLSQSFSPLPSPPSNPEHTGDTPSLVSVLDEDGKIIPNTVGSFDPSGFRMSYDPVTKAPRFSKQGSLIGTWDTRFAYNGLNSRVRAIAVSGSDVYVGGTFTDAGGVSGTSRIARWDGTNWNALGTGLNSIVYAIVVNGSDVYVGGVFYNAGGNANADYIARWDGTSWNPLGTGVNNPVRAIAISSSDVYVGGDFTNAGGNANADRIARWDGTSWNALGTGTTGPVRAIVVNGSDVYVGGEFANAGGNANADYIARWDGTNWNALGATPLNDWVRTLVISGSDVYVGGDFTNAGGNANADRIARWDGTSWNALGTGTNSWVHAIAVSGSDVYVGGQFTNAGGNANADYIARWDGMNWNALGTGVNDRVFAIAVSSSASPSVLSKTTATSTVFAGGEFTTAGGNTSNYFGIYTEGVLPISLVSAGATVQDQTATLRWYTASELNNERFLIEEKTPKGWQQIGEVKGAGTTLQAQSYTFEVSNLSYGTHTFRITQVDYDGTKTSSDPFSVLVELATQFELSEVYPNPFNPSATFTLTVANAQQVKIVVYDLTGREVTQLYDGVLSGQTTHTFQLDGSRLSSGRYVIQVEGENFVSNRQVVLLK